MKLWRRRQPSLRHLDPNDPRVRELSRAIGDLSDQLAQEIYRAWQHGLSCQTISIVVGFGYTEHEIKLIVDEVRRDVGNENSLTP